MELTPADLARASAYRTCERLAAAHYENFPVASRLLPAAMRPHVAALYAVARTADDFADEGAWSEQERLALLDDWLARLRACVTAVPGGAAACQDAAGEDGPHDVPRAPIAGAHPGGDGASAGARRDEDIFLALAHTIRARALPVPLFEDLLSAFRQDVTVRRYATWTEVLDYCRRSANPVGRLVLRIAGYDDPVTDRASDCLCTALQLTNFWQDLDRDWRNGRLYLPLDEVRACGADERDLDGGRLTPEWRRALGRAAVRTRALFDEGRLVCDRVSGRLRLELRLTWLGGTRILDRLEASGFDVFARRPSLGPADLAPLAWRAIAWRRTAPGAAA